MIQTDTTSTENENGEERKRFLSSSSFIRYRIDADVVSTLNKAQLVGYCGAALFSTMYLFGGFFGDIGSNALVLGGNMITTILGITSISAIPISSYLAGACFLMGLFLYDSVAVFGTEAMITVATKIDGPIKLLFPTHNPNLLI